MIAARKMTGTAAPAGSVLAVGVFSLDRRLAMPVVALSALLTTTPPAASAIDTHRFEDTALRTRPELPALSDCAMMRRIQEISSYEAGWDGPDSFGPTVETVKQARDFVSYLRTLGGIAQPRVSLANDGEINFYWKTSKLALDLGFTGTGYYSYFGTTPEGNEFIGDDLALGHPLPEGLLAALRA